MRHEPEETLRAEHLFTGYAGRNGTHDVVTPDINASLRSGELTCLLGPNGAGKSTLLKTLAGFLPPVSGEIFIAGTPVGDYSAEALARTVGVVLTDRPQVSAMTVEELVSLGRSPYTGFWGRLSADDRRAVDEAIALAGIDTLRSRAVATLSDGERQKAMIAKALAQEAPVVFLDEPAAFLDYPAKVDTMRLLRRLARRRGMTVFLSTHDLELALQTADRLWLIDRPHGLTVGTPEECARRGDIARYFASPGVVFDPRRLAFSILFDPDDATPLPSHISSPSSLTSSISSSL